MNRTEKIASESKLTHNSYRLKIGTVDKKKGTSAYVNVQARVTITNGMDIDSNFRRFRSILNPWVSKHTNNLFNGIKTSIIKSCDYTDSSRSHSTKNKTVLNFELTFLFDKPIDYKKELHTFKNIGFELTEFFDSYDGFKLEGSAK